MSGLLLTCDRVRDGLLRVALWQGSTLVDFLAESPEAPDLTGALFAARIVRVGKNGKAAWADAGLCDHLYVDKAEGLKTGDLRCFRIKISPRGNKAAAATLVEGKAEESGLLEPPPPLWARMLLAAQGRKIAALRFADRADHKACTAFLTFAFPALSAALEPVSKVNPHPDLEEALEPFLTPNVALPGGASLVIERTEALIAIDVNGGEAQNALAVNLAAVKEIARHIRIRNLSGIIVIDALKMTARPDASKLLNALTRATEADPAGVSIFGLTKLGLIEMTRRRNGAALDQIAIKDNRFSTDDRGSKLDKTKKQDEIQGGIS